MKRNERISWDVLGFFIRDFAVEQPGISMNGNERISWDVLGFFIPDFAVE